MSAAPELEMRGVAVGLGGSEILAGVDLEVSAGEVVGLLGRNGAGKTTLLRAAMGALPALRGEIRVAGRPLGELGRRELAQHVAVVPQDLHVPFPFSVAELVLMGRAPHQSLLGFETPEDVERARAALERLGIEHLADRSCNELSGGERQLVLVAMAVAQGGRLIILDEPTVHLDLRHQVDVLSMLTRLAGDGLTVLSVLHDLPLAAHFFPRLVLLDEGRIVADGRPAEVLSPERIRSVYGVDPRFVPALA